MVSKPTPPTNITPLLSNNIFNFCGALGCSASSYESKVIPTTDMDMSKVATITTTASSFFPVPQVSFSHVPTTSFSFPSLIGFAHW